MLAIDPVVAPGIISSDYLGSFHTLRSISKTGRVPGFSIDFFFKKIISYQPCCAWVALLDAFKTELNYNKFAPFIIKTCAYHRTQSPIF